MELRRGYIRIAPADHAAFIRAYHTRASSTLLHKEHDEVLITYFNADGEMGEPIRKQVHSSRATRLLTKVGGPPRLHIVKVHRKTPQWKLAELVENLIWTDVALRDLDGRTQYQFLGFTDAGLKTGQLIFLKEDKLSTRDLLDAFGDLDTVYVNSGYGKYAARLQLSFTSTVPGFEFEDSDVVEIGDLKAADHSLHTDGCGLIRESVARMICQIHGLPIDTSVFQVRRGGIKGLLVSHPDDYFESTLSEDYGVTAPSPYLMAYRPSMLKYNGGPRMLELHSVSSCPSSARLNRHLIILLLSRGIPLEVFRSMLQEQLGSISCFARNRDVALRYIGGDLDASISPGKLGQDVFETLYAGQELSEPYVESRLKTYQNAQYVSLRKKLSIRVEASGYLYGVMDEYGLLEQGEVLINLPERTIPQNVDVVVARTPSYFPAGDYTTLIFFLDSDRTLDIRVFRMVDRNKYPILKHLTNCIVFSRNSPHSIPDTMASGDLDGDKYFVSWDPHLVPKASMPYEQREPFVASALKWDLDDMKYEALDTFLEYCFNPLLGMIVTEWERAALATPRLAAARYPRELARLAESALDMVKTGQSPEELGDRFKDLKAYYASHYPTNFSDPLTTLRSLIPEGLPCRTTRFECDKALLLQDDDPTQWSRQLTLGAEVIDQFNMDLKKAIDADRLEDEYNDTGGASESRTGPSEADVCKTTYVTRYFGGGSRMERLEQEMRASAWYFFGYTRQRQTFAWLGIRYLNKIKAESTAGSKPCIYVGSRSHSFFPEEEW
ncbi:hypothetical protein JAAARDRAFT_200044 [Jaapia argillacea MUCL 33604]|uniref:RNA-dependent RNA polymerase n=1 Tax=Jaapia argillacea MUCL 33604 TaxID=933084 RepID=A0A067PIS9_9AGAM|nr:hypothetical protein JAAARDRAFT_200044 [Jaapia argillacea MUCL 33604]